MSPGGRGLFERPRRAGRRDGRREPVDLAAKRAVTGCYGATSRGVHHLPNDRSVDAMLDHPWIIDGEPVGRDDGERFRRATMTGRSSRDGWPPQPAPADGGLRLESRLGCARARARQPLRNVTARPRAHARVVSRNSCARTRTERRTRKTALGRVNGAVTIRETGVAEAHALRTPSPYGARLKSTARLRRHGGGGGVRDASDFDGTRANAAPWRGIRSKRRIALRIAALRGPRLAISVDFAFIL